MPPIVFFVIATLLALAYAYWNGANDVAHAKAPVIVTKALGRRTALWSAGFLNFAGLGAAVLLGAAVSKTIAKSIVPPEFVTQEIIITGLIGAVAWAALATRLGIPISITHCLVAGVAGSGIAAGGFSILAWDTVFSKILLGIALAPVVGFIAGFGLLMLLKWVTFRIKASRYSANTVWRWMQIVSSSWLSFSHGMNDGQNALGIMALAFFAAGFTASITITWWMILLSGAAIGLGAAIGGWRVIKTVGWDVPQKNIDPIDAFAAETAAGGVLVAKSLLGMPVSTTHVSVSAICGALSGKSFRLVNWNVTRSMVAAWIFTLPGAASLGAGAFFILSFIGI